MSIQVVTHMDITHKKKFKMKEYKVVEVSFEKESTYYLIKSRTVNPSLIERIFGYGKWYTATDGAGDNIRKYKTEEEAKETITKHIKKRF